MCGLAVAELHVTSEEFFDLSPAEFYYALRVVGKNKTAEYRARMVAARLTGVLVINSNPYLKTTIDDPRKVVTFPWEEELGGVGDMRNSVMAIAATLGAKVVHRSPDDPPTNPVKKKK